MYQNGVNGFLYASVLSVNLISIAAGSALSWSYTIFPKLISNDLITNPLELPITPIAAILLETIALIGCLQGAVAARFWYRKLGSKKVLLLFSSNFFIGHLLCSSGETIEMFLVVKFLFGLGVGCVLTIVPSFLAEIAEDSNRGKIGCVMGTMITIGITMNFIIGASLNMEVFCFINLVFLGLFYFTFLPHVPESPYYYAYLGDLGAAEKSLSKYRAKEDNREELAAITDCISKTALEKHGLGDLFKLKAFSKGLIVSCGLLIFQLLPGYYFILHEVANMSQLDDIIFKDTFYFAFSGVQIFTNVFSMMLVDRVRKKPLLLVSAFGTSILLLFLGVFLYLDNLGVNVEQWYALYISGTFLFIIFYNLGLSSVVWTVTGEIFSISAKPAATCVSVCVWSIATFVFGFLFPYLGNLIGLASLCSIYGLVMALAGVFIALVVPETTGKSLLKVHVLFGREK